MLYHDVTWTVGLKTARSLFGGLEETNPGLKYVRSITLTPCVSAQDRVVLHGWIEQLEYFFEPGTLQRLFSEFRIAELSERYEVISGQQRTLSTILVRVAPSKTMFEDGYVRKGLQWYASCMNGKAEGMFWLDELDATSSPRRILTHCEQDEVTTFDVMFENPDPQARERATYQSIYELVDACPTCASCSTVRSLHSQRDNGSKLRNLSFRRASFRTCGDLFRRFWDRNCFSSTAAAYTVHLEKVTTLILQDCSHCAEVLSALADKVAYISLKNLTVISSWESDTAAPHFAEYLNKLLKRFVGLQTLVISAPVATVAPKVSVLALHAATLKNLCVAAHDLDSDGIWSSVVSYSRPMLSELCRSCTQLEQLALSFSKVPPDTLDQVLKEGSRRALFDLRQHIAPLTDLPKLTTLRILNGFVLPSDRDFPSYKRKLSNTLLASLLRIFHDAGHSSLSVLSTGNGSKGAICSNGIKINTEPACVVIRKARSKCWFEKSNSLELVKRELVKYDEPRSEILDVQHSSQYFLRFPRTGRSDSGGIQGNDEGP